jgi:glucosamine 6-phosphate synthetase-like amidotransferase/phosphosugar isomerase protein
MLTLILVNMQLLAYHIAVVRGTHADVVKPWDSGILGDAV